MQFYFTYILYSEKIDRYYVGYCHDLALRLERHNGSGSHYTKRGIPWKLVYSEKHATETDAMKREQTIKRMKSRKYFEALMMRDSSLLNLPQLKPFIFMRLSE